MTTDTTALQEQLAEALHYGQGLDDWGVANDDERGEALDLAAAVLPIIAAEVRAAKAEALRGEARYFASGLHCADMRSTPEETVRHLDRRATEHETGDRA